MGTIANGARIREVSRAASVGPDGMGEAQRNRRTWLDGLPPVLEAAIIIHDTLCDEVSDVVGLELTFASGWTVRGTVDVDQPVQGAILLSHDRVVDARAVVMATVIVLPRTPHHI